MFTVIHNNRIHSPPSAEVADGDLFLSGKDAQTITGNATPVDQPTNVSALWREHLRPVVSDRSQQVWSLGASAQEASNALQTLQAPDFTLPDLEGNAHSLSDFRGKKVFLTTWASW